jgi:hypothetical protein
MNGAERALLVLESVIAMKKGTSDGCRKSSCRCGKSVKSSAVMDQYSCEKK